MSTGHEFLDFIFHVWTVPEVLPLVRAYKGDNLHIILEDGNIEDKDIDFCFNQCIQKDDQEGMWLCTILMGLSKTQRLKVVNRRLKNDQ